MNINNQEPINKYINVLDVCGNNVSVLDTEVKYNPYYDIYNEFEIVKYVINHSTGDDNKLKYSIDKIECMTDNWVNEVYDIQYIKCNASDIGLNVGIDTEYKIYNRNKLASELFGIDCAGNTIFWFDEYLNETELKHNIKEIKNFCMRTNLINYADIKI